MTRSGFKASLEDVFGVPSGSLRDSDSRDTIAAWSSVVDVQILTMITSEFGLEPDSQLLEAESVGDLLSVLDDAGVFPA
jgi:hypothetical protein